MVEREKDSMAGVVLHDVELQPRGYMADLVKCETEHYRSHTEAPLRKLTVDLIKTYRKINDVCYIIHVV